MKSVMKILACCSMMALSGCLIAPFQPPEAVITHTKAPLSTEGNWSVGMKQGSASSKSILGIIATGDCSVSAAAKNGNLTKVSYLDYDYLNILGIYQRVTIYAYGE